MQQGLRTLPGGQGHPGRGVDAKEQGFQVEFDDTY